MAHCQAHVKPEKRLTNKGLVPTNTFRAIQCQNPTANPHTKMTHTSVPYRVHEQAQASLKDHNIHLFFFFFQVIH